MLPVFLDVHFKRRVVFSIISIICLKSKFCKKINKIKLKPLIHFVSYFNLSDDLKNVIVLHYNNYNL